MSQRSTPAITALVLRPPKTAPCCRSLAAAPTLSRGSDGATRGATLQGRRANLSADLVGRT